MTDHWSGVQHVRNGGYSGQLSPGSQAREGAQHEEARRWAESNFGSLEPQSTSNSSAKNWQSAGIGSIFDALDLFVVPIYVWAHVALYLQYGTYGPPNWSAPNLSEENFFLGAAAGIFGLLIYSKIQYQLRKMGLIIVMRACFSAVWAYFGYVIAIDFTQSIISSMVIAALTAVVVMREKRTGNRDEDAWDRRANKARAEARAIQKLRAHTVSSKW